MRKYLFNIKRSLIKYLPRTREMVGCEIEKYI